MSGWFLEVTRLLLLAQTTQAAITGIVSDVESGEPLASAVVALTDVERSVTTDARGRYVFAGVPAGPQHVTVRRIGYLPRALHALVPSSGELRINITLAAAPVTLRRVEVRPPVAIRGVDDDARTAPTDRLLSAAALRNHPMLAELDAFLGLAGGGIVMRPEAPAGIHVRGGAPDQTAFVLDGIPILSPYHAAGTFSAWNPDALNEIRVSSSRATSDALSGVVTGATRTPSARMRTAGSATNTQARVTIDGPVGVAGAGFLVSARSGFLGFIDPKRETSYLLGETGDLLAKVELPLVDGRLTMLAYDSENEISALATSSEGAGSTAPRDRNGFAWHSQSVGGQWTRARGSLGLRLAAWKALSDAGATWRGGDSIVQLASDREDIGVLASAAWRSARTMTTGGLHHRRSRTGYRVWAANDAGSSLGLAARTPVTTAFVDHERSLGRSITATIALSAADVSGRLHPESRAEIRWDAFTELTVSASFDRSRQFAQSLRNSESVVGSIFPVDLFIGTGAAGVPVARSDRGVVAAEWRVRNGVRLGAEMYARTMHGLLLVAPRTGAPFVDRDFAIGAGTARGLSLDAAVSAARYGIVASYGWQHVRLHHDGRSYVPQYGTSHVVETGMIVFPSSTSSIRFGVTGEAGRRTTPVSQPFEWEACNLLDDGCELGGSPNHVTDQLGATRLPGYLRLDLGARKHWHLGVAGRDAQIGLFGTVTNVLGRKNVFTVASGSAIERPALIHMRPRAPLVVGLDWRF